MCPYCGSNDYTNDWVWVRRRSGMQKGFNKCAFCDLWSLYDNGEAQAALPLGTEPIPNRVQVQ